MNVPSTRSLVTALVGAALVGCSADSTTPGGANAIAFSVSTADATVGVSGMHAAYMRPSYGVSLNGSGSLVIGIGADTLRIDSIKVVLAQISLFTAADSTCGDDGHDDMKDNSCSPLAAGPIVVRLPLTAGDSQVMSVPVPKNTYTGMSFRVHKPNTQDTSATVTAFLAAHPEWKNLSIKVDGAFDGQPVHWQGDPVVQVKEKFSPPVVVSDTSGLNFTLHVSAASWFVAQNGSLINPNSATGPLYPQIAMNINKSFHAFEDDKHNGHDDGKHDGGTTHP